MLEHEYFTPDANAIKGRGIFGEMRVILAKLEVGQGVRIKHGMATPQVRAYVSRLAIQLEYTLKVEKVSDDTVNIIRLK